MARVSSNACVDSILDFIREKTDEDLLSQAGVGEEEDLFSSRLEKRQKPLGLVINQHRYRVRLDAYYRRV